MRSAYTAAIAAIAIAVACSLAAPATAHHFNDQPTQPPASCTAPTFREFSAAVWALEHWQRGRPRAAALAQQRRRLRCAPPAHRHAMKLRWRADGDRYFAYRHHMRIKRIIEPYWGCTAGGCDWWAIPAPMVNCESGGGSTASNIYQNLTGSYYDGMSKWQQSVAAHRILVESGLYQPWLQWESGCDGYPWGLL